MQDEDLFHVSTYSNYEKNEKSKYDLSIISVSNSFLNSIENLVIEGRYIKIVENGETVSESTTKAWKKVWDMTYRGEICRLFTTDYEKVISLQHSVDGKAHCYLYIAVR